MTRHRQHRHQATSERQIAVDLREVISTARARGLKIFFVPHHRWTPGDYVSFDNPSAKAQVFAKDSWGGTFHDDFQAQAGDVVVQEHWGSSGFANSRRGQPHTRSQADVDQRRAFARPVPDRYHQAQGIA
jgi:nicotinamidase-related amidase